MSKAKPLLHRVRGAMDPELYQSDLDWYFGCFDALCGIKSVSDMGYLLELSPGNSRTSTHIEDPNDEHPEDRKSTTFVPKAGKQPVSGSNTQEDAMIAALGGAGKARRVWARLRLLPWATQQYLAAVYEARRVPIEADEAELRAAHRAYMDIL